MKKTAHAVTANTLSHVACRGQVHMRSTIPSPKSLTFVVRLTDNDRSFRVICMHRLAGTAAALLMPLLRKWFKTRVNLDTAWRGVAVLYVLTELSA